MVSDPIVRAISSCRICRGKELLPVIDLGNQALTGCFPAAGEPDPAAAPLELVRCTGCGLVQLRHSVDPEEMFGDGYGYRSGINPAMSGHLANLAGELSERARLKNGDGVLDIGCNDGTLLKSYVAAGIERYGIDPTAGMFREFHGDLIKAHAGFFTKDAFRALSGRQTARVVTSIAMFYDLEDPAAFVADIAAVLALDGIWVLEQSYLPLMLEQNSFDTICHEHLEYYALAQIERLAAESGLRIFDVRLNGINGGSFQLWVCHMAGPYVANTEAIDALRHKEQSLELMTEAPYERFRNNIAAIGVKLRELIEAQTRLGKKVYVYGASTKGNVLLQYFRLDRSLITACAEKNSLKWGHRTPGTGIPIVSEDDARKDADFFLVLPWHFKEEFLKREASFRARGGKFIFPLPDVEVC